MDDENETNNSVPNSNKCIQAIIKGADVRGEVKGLT